MSKRIQKIASSILFIKLIDENKSIVKKLFILNKKIG